VNHSIEIFIPTTFGVTGPATSSWHRMAHRASLLADTKTKMARLFGGYTAHSALGGWVSDKRGLVEEPVHIVHSAYGDESAHHVPEVFKMAGRLAKVLGQEAVTVRHNGKMHFVPPEE